MISDDRSDSEKLSKTITSIALFQELKIQIQAVLKQNPKHRQKLQMKQVHLIINSRKRLKKTEK